MGDYNDGLTNETARGLAKDYEDLRDKIIELFNPPDEDMAEPYIMEKALERAAELIGRMPCFCIEMARCYDAPEIEPCPRCSVLGIRIDPETFKAAREER